MMIRGHRTRNVFIAQPFKYAHSTQTHGVVYSRRTYSNEQIRRSLFMLPLSLFTDGQHILKFVDCITLLLIHDIFYQVSNLLITACSTKCIKRLTIAQGYSVEKPATVRTFCGQWAVCVCRIYSCHLPSTL